jgi:hypothetical protein
VAELRAAYDLTWLTIMDSARGRGCDVQVRGVWAADLDTNRGLWVYTVGGCSPWVRTVKTASGATAVQIVYSNRRGSR